MKIKRKTHPRNRIAYWRKLRKKTLDDVGKELGIKRSGVSLKEKGKSPVETSELYILAKFFKCSPWEIIEEESRTAEEMIKILENSPMETKQNFDDMYQAWRKRAILKNIDAEIEPEHGKTQAYSASKQ